MTTPADPPGRPPEDHRRPLAVLACLFFMWGGITALNDVLIPHLKGIFDLTYFRGALVQSAFFSGYLLFAWPAGWLVTAVGYRWAMVAGLGVMAVGTAGFAPAAAVPSYPLFLAALAVLAAGITVLQVSANPYVTALGPAKTAPSRLNLTQGFNALGTTLFPYLGGLLILGKAAARSADAVAKMSPADRHAYQLAEAGTVRLPYLVLSAVLVALAVVIAVARLPQASGHEPDDDDAGGDRGGLWSHRTFVLAAVGVFLYVGAEVAVGSFLIPYLSTPTRDGGIVGMPAPAAAKWVTVFWGGAMLGRFVGAAVLRRVDVAVVLGTCAAAALALVVTSMVTTGHFAMATILAVGLFNSVLFPSLFTIGFAGLGPLTARGSTVMVAACFGGAVVPLLQGLIADRVVIHHAFILPVLCYGYIVCVAFDCRRGRRDRSVSV